MAYSQQGTISGLETLTMNMDQAGNFTLSAKISLPVATSAGAASQVVATVKQNGTTIFTSTAGADGFSIPVLVAVNDTLSVALTSSEAEDVALNAVKAAVSLG